MSDPPENFEDPELKLALRRALASDPSSAAMKERVAAIVSAELARGSAQDGPAQKTLAISAQQPSSPRRSFIRRPAFRRIAIAAVLLITVGLVRVLIDQRHHAAEHEQYLQANLGLFRDMVRAEETTPPQPTTFPVSDPGALSKDLSAKLGRPVPVPDFHAQGWIPVYASIGPVGTHNGARICYRNGNRQMLFVSLPASALATGGDEEDELYAYVVDDHPVAGFVKTGSLNCCIGDKSMPLSELTRLKFH